MSPEVIEGFAKQGLLGLVILALGWYIMTLRADVKAKDTKLEEANEKRIAEAREGIKAIEQNTNTLDTLAEVLKARQS